MSGISSLTLPRRKPRAEDAAVRFGPPEKPATGHRKSLRPGAVYRRIEQDIESGEQRIEVLRDDGHGVNEETGVATEFHKILRYRIHPDDPTTARCEADYDMHHHHDQGWDMRIRSHSAIACTATEFIVEADLQAFEGDLRIFSRSWTERIPRDLG